MKSILVFCLLLPFFYVKAQKNRPLLHLMRGQTYYLESNDTSTSLQSIGGKENKVNTIIYFRTAFSITGITDTLYSLETRYQSLAMKIKLADTTLNMSSEVIIKPDTPSMIMARIVNKPFIVTITSGGKVRSIKNLDKLIAGAFSDFPSIDSVKKKKVTDQFVQAFGEGAVKGLLEMGIAVLPAKPIAKYDRWLLNSMISSPALTRSPRTCCRRPLPPAFRRRPRPRRQLLEIGAAVRLIWRTTMSTEANHSSPMEKVIGDAAHEKEPDSRRYWRAAISHLIDPQKRDAAWEFYLRKLEGRKIGDTFSGLVLLLEANGVFLSSLPERIQLELMEPFAERFATIKAHLAQQEARQREILERL